MCILRSIFFHCWNGAWLKKFENPRHMKYVWYDVLQSVAIFEEIKGETCLIVRLWGGDMECVSENVGTVQGRIKVEVHGLSLGVRFQCFWGGRLSWGWTEPVFVQEQLLKVRSRAEQCGAERGASLRQRGDTQRRTSSAETLWARRHASRRRYAFPKVNWMNSCYNLISVYFISERILLMTSSNSALITRVPPWCCLYLAALWLFHPGSAFQLQDGMSPFRILAQATI